MSDDWTNEPLVLDFEHLARSDVGLVGGKNSSLGEMIRALGPKGIPVPPGFATSSYAYWHYVDANNIRGKIDELVDQWQSGHQTLAEIGHAIRILFLRGTWPADTAEAILSGYRDLCDKAGVDDLSVAVRSSATAEDLPDASFAGQQETYLNIQGSEALLDACRRCYASLFTDRAISYRHIKKFNHGNVALSIGIQQMVRSDIGGAGVMFSIDTESGFDKIVLINAAWGLGENVVQGTVNPDEYQIFKPLLSNEKLSPILSKKLGDKAIKMVYGDKCVRTRNVPTSRAERAAYVLKDEEILQLSRWACLIEEHYSCPMDMEWARDGSSGKLYIVQARPETVQSRRDTAAFKTYTVGERGHTLTTGLSIGDKAVAGRICLLTSVSDIDKFIDGSILVTEATDPDWVPVMKRAAAIVTDYGGRTSHAAIVSRELGVPAVVGTGNATYVLHTGQDVTVSCAEGDSGLVYDGISEITTQMVHISELPSVRTKIMLNLANPSAAYRWWRLPVDGIGLARMEFVVSNSIRVHPMALIHYDHLEDEAAKKEITNLTAGYTCKPDYFVDKLASGLATLCSSVYPKPAIIRMSDFKTNEYARLIGGAEFELKEENPMIGFRGASRYYSPRYKEGFALECRAVKKVREEMGLTNAIVMIPFCRTVKEARKVLDIMEENGLKRGENGLMVYVMCEIPSNVILASSFTQHFDGFSIGSNDLAQLTLGVDRDSGELASLFNEQDEAVKWMIARAITVARREGCKIGLCGEAPSNHPEFAKFLVNAGIDSISVSPDSFVQVMKHVVASEKGL
ncbi:phosphoenolpyruvate synthase [Fusarium oxysporum f. sp. raphani 54005]|uniref:pyruvate, water dikinase n=3 Tax=Fusarium oxysporum TaxID=5507 RepID=X0BZ98_FUSOX|nr:phosphoenolpyruvate synthase [Fusarium oxysporum f. sp. pisi HDV247]EXK87510.1 phosphoenolpyruvate synthase [Fusarium oxysporum f. sp. raphani 54005]KAG7427749.1 Phosphoenolpyruvate synthase [Fusarium oxysporum f. sp. raphani]WKT52409.1 PEP-utilizing enzyme, C-terminal [Fusarium oxysporum f. sp. vasinfectum]